MGLDLANTRLITVSAARLGDVLFCTPAYRFIKETFPSSSLDVVSLSPISDEVLSRNPYVDRIINAHQPIESSYDIALNLHDSPTAQRLFKQINLATISIPRLKTGEHTCAVLMQSLAKLFGVSIALSDCHYDLFVEDTDEQALLQLLKEQDVNLHEPLLGLHLGCHGLSKTRWRIWGRKLHPKAWPLEHFIDLIQELDSRYAGFTYVITGSKQEVELVNKLKKLLPTIKLVNLVGLTNVHTLRCLMDHLRVYVCADTGVQHVACSSQVPLVSLFRKGYAEYTGPFPFDARKHTLCQAEHLQDLSAVEVVQAIRGSLTQGENHGS